jgi:hypothetical protein
LLFLTPNGSFLFLTEWYTGRALEFLNILRYDILYEQLCGKSIGSITRKKEDLFAAFRRVFYDLLFCLGVK